MERRTEGHMIALMARSDVGKLGTGEENIMPGLYEGSVDIWLGLPRDHRSSVTRQICAVVTHNANQSSSTVWAVWGLIYYNNSPNTHTRKSLTAITHSHSFTYGIYNVQGNYPATDFTRLSLLVSVVLIVARITQLGSPLLQMKSTRSRLRGYSAFAATLSHFSPTLSIQYWLVLLSVSKWTYRCPVFDWGITGGDWMFESDREVYQMVLPLPELELNGRWYTW